MKKLSIFLVCGLLFTANLSAQTWNIGQPAVPGSLTSAVTATLQDGTLTISGTGGMHWGWRFHDWSWIEFPLSPPWSSVRHLIHTVIIEDGVTNININAFMGIALTSVTIPNSVTFIRESAFANTQLTSVTIPNSVRNIGSRTFGNNTNLTNLIIEDGESELRFSSGSNATDNNANSPFFGSPIETLYIGRTIVRSTSTHTWLLFGGTNLREVTIGNSVTATRQDAFRDSRNLTSVTIGNSVTSIGNRAFQNTGLTSINIPNSVTAIGISAFRNCTALTSVTIPSNVATIGDFAFAGCTGLRSVTSLRPAPPAVQRNTFQGVNVELCTLYVVPDGLLRYQTTEVWREFWTIRAIDPTSNVDVVNATEIQFFPNPVTHELRIINHDWQANDVVELYDMSGRLVFSERVGVFNTPQQGEFVIDMSSFKSGNYILRIGNRVAKVVKK